MGEQLGPVPRGIMKLPDEILLMVIDELEFSSLSNISIANRLLNQLSNPRLWQHFSMHEDHGRKGISALDQLNMIISGCSAIRRDPQRAAYIKSLSIRILQNFSQPTLGLSTATSHIRDALFSLTSLRRLILDIPSQAVGQSISQMFSTNALMFSFHLLELRLSQQSRLAFSAFLESQDSVEIFHMSLDRRNSNDVLDISKLLPRISRQEVPMGLVKESVKGRHLQSLHLEGFVKEHRLHLWTLDPPSVLSDDMPESLAIVHEVSFPWPVSGRSDPKLLPFLTFQCGISLSMISSLFIRCHRWPERTSFRDVIFGGLPSLTNLEWCCTLGNHWVDNMDETYLHTFAQDAANASPLLKRLTMTSRWRRTLDFFRVSEGVSNQSSRAPALEFAFTDTRGSTWFVSTLPREKRSYRWDRPLHRCDCIV